MTKTNKWVFPLKLVWLAIFMTLFFRIGSAVFSEYFLLVLDTQDQKCIPEHSLYLVVKRDRTHIERGNIYSYAADNLSPFFEDGTLMGKYAAGIEGDEVVINERGVFINGELFTTGFALVDKLNIEESELYKKFTVPSGKVFFLGTGERSYDGRYWGFADVNQIVGRAIPIW